MNRPLELRVAVTGTSWMGGSIGSVDTALREIVTGARRELQLVAYELRTDAKHFLEMVEDRLASGVNVTFVVNRLDKKPLNVRGYLADLAHEYPGMELYTFAPPNEDEDLHAKLVIADREQMLIGSANLSWRGLVENHEIAVRLRGAEVSNVSSAVDKLLGSPHIRRIGPMSDV